jgi:hypothetical protein
MNPEDIVESRLAYVVLPAGHGKSCYHNPDGGLIEIDQVYGPRDDEDLSAERNRAKATGEWDLYDKLWTDKVKANLVPGCWVVMVQSDSLGKSLGAERLGGGQLTEGQWRANLTTRGKQPSDYAYGTGFEHSYEVFESNEDLMEWLKVLAYSWLITNLPIWLSYAGGNSDLLLS